jgi:cytosine/uracil/thiamine/allantoin permease
MGATFAGIAAALVGLIVPQLGFLFRGAWFTATAVAFAMYYFLMRGEAREQGVAPPSPEVR